MARRRVVVTGLGIISPVGIGVSEAWSNIVAGKSGISRITRFDAGTFPTQIAGEVKGFDVAKWLPPKEARRFDTFIHYGLAAAIDALKDSGIDLDKEQREQIGVCIGSGIGGLPLIEDTHNAVLAGGVRKISPFFVPGTIINMISGQLSIMYDLKGPNIALVTACTTANHCIGEAGRLIEYGDADVMIAGGAEATISPLGVGGFCAARALSTRNDAPEQASRPWDRDRDGFVLGEGSGVLVLEEYEHATKRGARIYCELAGYGMSADAHHITAPSSDGEGAARCMANAMRNGGVNTGEVDYINAHGTSTPLGDIAETIALKRCFGEHAKKLAVSSTKSMTGHLLGAAGGIEAVFSALSLHRQIAPPTINLINQDPQCDLDYVPNTARQMRIEVAISNSFGFGGTNGSLVFRAI
ncbi:MAG TPA: beta-ketoacyl-ACP synthase II [Burkholderiales bacterium]|nr:beta-ketoacyl-ACP synthase II [Burkholderiales bacterium]